MSALVSFERVFEILDLKPLIRQKPDAVSSPAGPLSVEFDDVRFSYPSADKVSLASLEDVSTLDTRGGEEVLHGISRVEPARRSRSWAPRAPASPPSRSCCRACTTSIPVRSASAGRAGAGWTSVT